MFLKFLFYSWGLLAILFEIMVMKSPKKYNNYIQSIVKIKKSDKPSGTQIALILLMCGYMAWGLIGLFSSQWVLFAALIILSWIPKLKFWILCWIDSVLTLPLLIFILLNAFHLHIDVWKLISTYF